MKTAVVLSGGGARGAYQIGVWKALRKLHMKYDIVTGTSVGALNGALLVQNTYHQACRLWKRIDFPTVFQEEEMKDIKQNENVKNLITMYAKNIVNGGMNVEKLENIVKKYINPKKMQKSKIAFGIITVNNKTKKPKIITKENLNINQLCDYLIASASCYPVFQKKKIDKEEYIDGGFFDNLPINLAIDLGANSIIAVDLKAVGRVQKVKDSKIPIITISPNNDIGSFLVFNRTNAKKAMKYGYNDTMKQFGHLEGKRFTFYKNETAKNNHILKTRIEQFLFSFFKVEKETTILQEVVKTTAFRRMIQTKKVKEKNLNQTLEYIGHSFHLDESRIYSIRSFKKIVKKEFEKTRAVSTKNIAEQKIPETKEIIKYFYVKLTAKTKYKKKELTNLAVLFPKEFLSAVYLKEWFENGK